MIIQYSLHTVYVNPNMALHPCFATILFALLCLLPFFPRALFRITHALLQSVDTSSSLAGLWMLEAERSFLNDQRTLIE